MRRVRGALGQAPLTDIAQMTSRFAEIIPRTTVEGTVSPLQPSDGLILEISPRLEAHLPSFSAIQTHSSCRFHLAVDVPGLRRSGSWSQIIDQAQDFPEQFPRHRHLGQLERDVAAMADHLGTDLHQLLPQRGQRPVLDLLRQSQRPHEVGEIVGQGVKLQPDGVIAEPATRQPRPFDRVLAFLDALLRFAPLIVEQCHPPGRSRQVGDDEPDPGKQLAGAPLHLGDDAAGLVPAFGPIAEAGVMAPHMVRRAANGSREQLADAFGL